MRVQGAQRTTGSVQSVDGGSRGWSGSGKGREGSMVASGTLDGETGWGGGVGGVTGSAERRTEVSTVGLWASGVDIT